VRRALLSSPPRRVQNGACVTAASEHSRTIAAVLRLGQTAYPLCLLDTMAVSEMVKRPTGAMRHFYEWAHSANPMFVPCFTIYTLMEIRRKPELFERFVEQFSPLPCLMIKGYAQLLDDEVAAYPDPTGVDPCAIAFTPIGGEGNKLTNLPYLLDLPQHATQERHWNEAVAEIVEGMVSLVPNFPPESHAYTRDEVRYFVRTASYSQLIFHAESFVQQMIESGYEIDMDAFPTLKAMTYTVFYKFYSDANRQPRQSDAFDVLIAAALPYVEAFITEAHQADALNKARRCDAFLDELHVFTLRDFLSEPPRAPTLRA